MKRKQYNAPLTEVVMLEASEKLCTPFVGSSTTTDDMMLSGRRGQEDIDWAISWEESPESEKHRWE